MENLNSLVNAINHSKNNNGVNSKSSSNDRIPSRFRSNSLETVWAIDNPSCLFNSIPFSNGNHDTMDCKKGTEKNYDPYDFGNNANAATFYGTVFHLWIVSAGPALLIMPKIFHDVGYVYGLVGTMFMILLYAYNINVFLSSEYKLCQLKRMPCMSYLDIAYHAFDEGPRATRWFAPYARYINFVIFAVVWIGGSAFHLLLIRNSLTVVCDFWQCNLEILPTVLLAILIAVFYYIPKLKYLEPFSVIASISNVTCVAFVVYFIAIDESPIQPQRKFGNIDNLPLFVGIMLYTINATGIMLSLKNEMGEPRKFNSKLGVLTVTYIPMSIAFAVFGLLCSLKYGDDLQHNVLLNLPQDQLISKVVNLLFLATLCFQFPLLMFTVYDVLWNDMLKETKKFTEHKALWQYGLKICLVAFMIFISATVPTLELFLSVCGTLATSIDSLIFPCIIECLVGWRTKGYVSKLTLFKNSLVCGFAIVVIYFGVNDCVKHIFNYYNKNDTTEIAFV